MTDFDIVGPEAIRDGRATDAYFERTEETLEAAGRNPHRMIVAGEARVVAQGAQVSVSGG